MNFKEQADSLRTEIIKEVKLHPFVYCILALVLLVSLFFRVYRTADLLGFYYDQGRDALVIWRLLHEGKLFLVGPVTGLSGIYLGPFYYYLIAPFYLIGGGHPRLPAVFLAFTSVLALLFLYYLGWKMHSRAGGLIAAVMGGMSYNLVLAGRWLSNPTPMLLLSMLILLLMWKIMTADIGKNWKKRVGKLWVTLAMLTGVSLQFESASAVFYLPMIAVFAVWQWRKLPEFKTILLSILVFVSTLLPQILFNFRHDNLLADSFGRVLVSEESFRSPLNPYNIEFKKKYFNTVFTSKIFPGHVKSARYFYLAAAVGVGILFIKKRKEAILLLVFLGVPAFGYMFFQGNHWNIYDYYVTGYYLPMVLLFSLGLAVYWRFLFGKIFIFWFLITFLSLNLILIKNFLNSEHGLGGVSLSTEIKAVDWVYGNAKDVEWFNVDIYVPPVIPHSYEYVFLWRGSKFCRESLCGLKKDENVQTLYTLYEEDPPHPERLSAWLTRQYGIGKVMEQIKFGNVTVQRRQRI